MNVFYIGVVNPFNVAVLGYKNFQLEVSFEPTGGISGSNGKYEVKPRRPGNLFIVVKHKNEIIQKRDFRVKTIPNPVAKIAEKGGGALSKKKLLEQTELTAEIEYFDSDLHVEIVEFSLSTIVNGFIKSAPSKSSKITEEQRNLIKKIYNGQSIYFEDIKCKDPDGIPRDMSTTTINVNDVSE